MEEKQNRLFLALMLSVLVFALVNYFFAPPPPPKKAETEKKEVVKPEPVKTPPVLAPTSPKVSSKDVKKITVKTHSHIVILSSLGARIEKFYAKNYKDAEGKEVVLVRGEYEVIDIDGEKFDAVELSRNKGFDFNFAQSKESLALSEWNNLNFSVIEDKKTNSYSFSAVSPNGKLLLKKTYIFFPGENYFKTEISLTNTSRESITFADRTNPAYLRTYGSIGPIPRGRDLNDQELSKFFRVYRIDGSLSDSVDGGPAWGFFERIGNYFTGVPGGDDRFKPIWGGSEGVDFAGTGSRYFIAVADTLNHPAEGVLLDNRVKNDTGVILSYGNIILEPGKAFVLDFANYVGIREWDGMLFRDSKLDPVKNPQSPFAGMSTDLNKSFNQGITTPLRNGIVWFLKKIHDYAVPNYGFAIILFALLFKLAFYPLNQKQAETMKRMQELSPEIKKINERFAKDPNKRQEKLMELYKKHNMNPLSQLGGCLPMFIQIPVFLALYTAFSDTIDLWKSPFLWIGDLSEPDSIWTSPAIPFLTQTGFSLNLLALLMVGTQFLSARMTSVPSDPNQKVMLYVMPIMMIFIFWSMPSGVTLYWTIFNLLSIGQQWITNHLKKNATPVKA
ncbi:preprotein translocase YidC [Leptospira perolatii]|uniref:Membrane protein insertase YidC n=1 Tax=Leptospira perolatii TaxID=2023191 RepID=A0A2M9ZL01_9LEPT|nr:membrane protein insertase YidC [Leptospira perolatii]PJZ69969.1 preprotein translocase YidC [Leptospira perolatii]PJZ72623.1 preprotein translocase YidC [Leptospira perolatii]